MYSNELRYLQKNSNDHYYKFVLCEQLNRIEHNLHLNQSVFFVKNQVLLMMDRQNQLVFLMVYFFIFYNDSVLDWRKLRMEDWWILFFLQLRSFQIHQFLFYRRLVLLIEEDLKNLTFLQVYFLDDPKVIDQFHWNLLKYCWYMAFRVILNSKFACHCLSKATSIQGTILRVHQETQVKTNECLVAYVVKGIFHKQW